MGPRTSLNTTHRTLHARPLPATRAETTAALAPVPRRGRVRSALRRFSLCVVVAGFAGTTLFTLAPATAQAVTMTKPEKQLLTLVNHVRAKHHLHALKMIASLERASRAHSRQMVHSGYFSHNSASGETFGARLIRFGYKATGYASWTAGENIAYGYQSSGTPHAIFMAWWHSAPHRRVMLTKRFRDAGVGRASGTFKGLSGVVFFTLDCGARTR